MLYVAAFLAFVVAMGISIMMGYGIALLITLLIIGTIISIGIDFDIFKRIRKFITE